MSIDKKLNDRIDEVIAKNHSYEIIVIALSIAIFILGVSLIGLSFYLGSVKLAIPSTFIIAFLYWPIKKIDQIRKENTALAVVPSLIKSLPPAEAAQEIVKLIGKLF